MSEFKNYVKTGITPMRPYVPGEDLTGVSLTEGVVPEEGGMIACDPNNESDMWYVAPEYFEDNYEEYNNED
jgi:hypothetical protein